MEIAEFVRMRCVMAVSNRVFETPHTYTQIKLGFGQRIIFKIYDLLNSRSTAVENHRANSSYWSRSCIGCSTADMRGLVLELISTGGVNMDRGKFNNSSFSYPAFTVPLALLIDL